MAQPSSASAFRPRQYRPALDGLRAFSILAVLLYHANYIVPGGYLGVDVFFVLSGFLITSILFDEWRTTGRIDLRRFYLRRALRLFPALAVLLLASVAFVLTFPHAPQSPTILRGVISSAFYVANWINARDPFLLGSLGHTWSLAVEEQFYLLWPLMLIGLLRITRGRRILAATVFGLAVGFALWRTTLFVTGSTPWRLYNGTDTRADSLLVGCAAAVATIHGNFPRLVGGRRSARWLAVGGCVLIGTLMAMTPLEWSGYYLGFLLVVALAAVAVVIGVLNNSDWWFSRLLASAPLAWIGRLSYSLYLWHYPIFNLLKMERLHVRASIVLVLKIVAAFVAAAASHYIVERPFLRLKRRINSPQRATGTNASSAEKSAVRLDWRS